MSNNNTRYWFFTWETNIVQKRLPSDFLLEDFLNRISDYAQFQKECGAKKKKLHYQGWFELTGARQSKKAVLDIFQMELGNVGGLSLRKLYSKEAAIRYTSKQETQASPTVYCGKKEFRQRKFQTLLSKPWQIDLFVFMKNIKLNDSFDDVIRHRKRSLIWLQDVLGNSGKSEYLTWLRTSQSDLVCRILPLDSVDRLLRSVYELTQVQKVDVFLIDDTKTKGEATSFRNMFEAIEKVKNGHVVSAMYGKYAETVYDRPQIIFCTNRKIEQYLDYLSMDRWYLMKIDPDKYLLKEGWVDQKFSKNVWDNMFGSSEILQISDDKRRKNNEEQ